MTLQEHNARCRCTPQEPCVVLAEILREQHIGETVEIADAGRLSRISARA